MPIYNSRNVLRDSLRRRVIKPAQPKIGAPPKSMQPIKPLPTADVSQQVASEVFQQNIPRQAAREAIQATNEAFNRERQAAQQAANELSRQNIPQQKAQYDEWSITDRSAPAKAQAKINTLLNAKKEEPNDVVNMMKRKSIQPIKPNPTVAKQAAKTSAMRKRTVII